jgi:hypothetical protein
MTPITFNIEKEQYAIRKLYKRTRKLLEKQLNALEATEGDIPASQIDVLLKSLRHLPEIMNSIEAAETKRRKREERKQEWEQIQQSLPAPAPGKPPVPAVDPYEEKPVEGIQLPFPALKTAVVNKGVQHE